MKKNKQKLLSAIGMLTVSATMLISSTFAWFSLNKKASVQNMSLKASTSSNLLISPDNASDATYDKELKKNIEALLAPSSTVNGLTYYYTLDAAADGHKVRGPNDEYPFLRYIETDNLTVVDTYAEKETYDKTFNQVYNISTANPETAAAFKTAYGYVDYVMYLKATSTEENQKIVMSKCNLLYKGEILEDKAWRAAILVQETSAKTQPTSVGDLVSIIAPTGAKNYNEGLAADTTSSIGDISKDNEEVVIDDSITSGESKYYKVVVRVWIEGEDTTCTTEIYGNRTDKYTLDLEYKIDKDIEGVKSIGSVKGD